MDGRYQIVEPLGLESPDVEHSLNPVNIPS